MELKKMVILVLGIAGVACKSRHDDVPRLPAECESFLSSYEKYVASSSPASSEIASARVEQTRRALLARRISSGL